jgi:adenylate kinase family enzyme
VKRIAIVGTSGSGKTTLARQIAARLHIPHVELDALHWGPNWTPAEESVFRLAVRNALAGDTWVADGNYRDVRDIVWPRADTLIWLDDTFPRIAWRLLRRTIGRAARHEELWHGNHENLRQFLFSRESLMVWALRTHWRHRREYPALIRRPEYAHLRVVHLTSFVDAERWLSTLVQRRPRPGPPLEDQP